MCNRRRFKNASKISIGKDNPPITIEMALWIRCSRENILELPMMVVDSFASIWLRASGLSGYAGGYSG